jgi:hypothetical protein
MNKLLSKESIVYIWLSILSVMLVIFLIVFITKIGAIGDRIDAVPTLISESLAKTHDVVKAKEFLLVDTEGNMRARLQSKATTPSGTVLLLSDADSNSTAEFGIKNHAPQFSLSDTKGSKRVFFGLAPDKDEQALLTLSSKDSNCSIELNAQSERSLGLFLYGKDGTIRSQLSTINDRPTFFFFDKKGNARISLGVTDISSPDGTETKTSESTMYLFGADGKPLWHAP